MVNRKQRVVREEPPNALQKLRLDNKRKFHSQMGYSLKPISQEVFDLTSQRVQDIVKFDREEPKDTPMGTLMSMHDSIEVDLTQIN